LAGKDVIFVLTTPLKQTAQDGVAGGNPKSPEDNLREQVKYHFYEKT
jgi:hypothetical protein